MIPDLIGFSSADRAALVFAICFNWASILLNKEFGSAIYTREVNGTTKYYYSKVFVGDESSVRIPPTEIPSDGTHVASVHTHAAYDPDYNNFDFSMNDMFYAINVGVPLYLVTSAGTIKKYDPVKMTKSDVFSIFVFFQIKALFALNK